MSLPGPPSGNPSGHVGWVGEILQGGDPMIYRLLADLLVVGHIAFVLYVVGGGLLVFRRPRIAFFHLPVAAWGAFIEFSGWICPLTPWEVHLRQLGGQAGYSGGFVEHYFLPVLYPAGLDREQQVWLGILVLGLNLGVYGWVIRRRVRGRRGLSPE